MSEKLKVTDLRETLANAEAELVTLVKRVEMLKEWIEITKKLCSKNSRSTVSMEVPPMIARSRRTKTSELAKQIVEVLEETGAPLHVKEIVAALAARGHQFRVGRVPLGKACGVEVDPATGFRAAVADPRFDGAGAIP